MSKKCICQICTCGRHKCPHNPNPKTITGPCPFSEYTEEYKEHPLEARVNFKPQYQLKTNNSPMDDMTTHKFDFIPHEVEKPYKRNLEIWQKPDGQMETLTNYHKDFTEKPLDHVKSFRPGDAKRNPGKFEGEPTYQADYKPWESKPRVKFGPPITDTKLSTQPFDGNTNYQTDYLPYKHQSQTKSMRPLEGPVQSDAPFIDSTDYKESYVKHPLEAKLVKDKIVWQPNTAAFDDLSSYKKDYTPKDLQKPENYKPDQTPFNSQAVFDESTTHKTDFQPWSPTEIRKPLRHGDSYQKPDGQMNFDTTTHLDYHAHLLQQPIRIIQPNPYDSLKRSKVRFDGTTNYSTDYQAWRSQSLERVKKPNDYIPNEAPFDGIPTYKIDFIPKKLTYTKSAKPLSSVYKSDVPLDGSTEYKKEYQLKFIEPCPAVKVQSGIDSRYEFIDRDEVGHLWYRYLSSSHGRNRDGTMITALEAK